MGNPLLTFWHVLFARGDDHEQSWHLHHAVQASSSTQASATIFLVLRRMRAPLIALIVIFAVSVLGLSLIPGRDDAGQPRRMTFFDAFYFMSYTATTIGFGEIPHAFTTAQRMWVTFSIYLTVIGWAYAIGSLLALLQDRTFRDALDLTRFTRKVLHLKEPFLLVAGYGQTGRLLGRALDERGRRFVVLDAAGARIDDLEVDPYRADVPGLRGDASNPGHLAIAGLGSSYCEGVVAITNDDEVNLAVTMAAAVLRPGLPVIASTTSHSIARRMAEFGDPVVINPFDRFGDRLSLALRAPSVHRLLSWLTSTTDGAPPHLLNPPPQGRWVVFGYGRFGREITEDFRRAGFDVTVVEPTVAHGDAEQDSQSHGVLSGADLATAVGLVTATGSDTTNLSIVSAARLANPSLFLVARQNLPANSPLYEAMMVDSLLVLPDMVAREALARLGHPLLWEFLSDVFTQDDAWAARLLDRLVAVCAGRSPHLWDVHVDVREAPAVVRRAQPVRLGDLLRDPDDRDHHLDAVPLLLLRGSQRFLSPDEGIEVEVGDELLLAGRPFARHVVETLLLTDASLEYAVTGRRVASGWVWRRIAEHVHRGG